MNNNEVWIIAKLEQPDKNGSYICLLSDKTKVRRMFIIYNNGGFWILHDNERYKKLEVIAWLKE